MASDPKPIIPRTRIPGEDYDVKRAFARIENELISSMMRNLKRHLKEEEEEGFDWSQWQVEQLKYLQEYRRRNQKEYGPRFSSINAKMEEAIRFAHENGQKDEEVSILNAISSNEEIRPRHATPSQPSIEGGGDAFFRINDDKLEALVEAAHNDLEKAEQAVLRRTNDQYRKIIFDAQMYANTGAGTVEKAVDMATKDFLAKGIDSIQYKNGARHTISDYADMYIRTAEKRAYLMGEGKKRQEWGESLVIVNRRGTMTNGNYGTACPQCIPWLGKILIDDVYSDGKPDGKHKLLSEAMAAGFLHPRCKDSFTTYIPGISPQEDPVTKEEAQEAVKAEKEEAKQQAIERQAERQDRLAEHSLDSENRQTARHRANQWKEQAAPFKPAETIEEAQEYAQQFCKPSFMDRTFKGQVDFRGISLEHANAINRSLTEAYSRFPEMEKLSGIKAVAPGSRQGKKAFKDGADALFSYSPVEHGIFINKDVLKNPKTLDAYMQRSKESWDLVMDNMDKLSGRQREIAEKYAIAGRSLVDGSTVEGLFTHELGHHVEWTMLDAKTHNALVKRMGEYAPHLSGYATTSSSEYLAESFVAYMKGEQDLLDSEYVKLLNGKSVSVDAESGRLARAAQRASEKETLQEMLRNSVTIGNPYVEPKEIQSETFSKKFTKLTDDSRINDRIRALAQGNLTKNNGTYTEMLDIIDLDTGNSVIHKRGKKNALEVALTGEERNAVRAHKGRIIGMHNHPTNIYPTGSDFVVAAARQYEFGIVITHDLRVYKYTGPKVIVRPVAIDAIIDKYVKLAYTEDDKRKAFTLAMKDLERRYGITWEEL